MFIKNNSDKEWKDYNCGDGVTVTIKPKATVEVTDAAGEVLLRNLGCDKWLVATSVGVKATKPEPKKEEPKKEIKIEREEFKYKK